MLSVESDWLLAIFTETVDAAVCLDWDPILGVVLSSCDLFCDLDLDRLFLFGVATVTGDTSLVMVGTPEKHRNHLSRDNVAF